MKYLFIILSLAFIACKKENNKVDAYGRFEADEVIISSQSNGKILKSYVSEGEKVTMGDTLAIIDTEMIQLQINQVTSKIDAARTKLKSIDYQWEIVEIESELAQKEFNRVKQLFAGGAATESQMDLMDKNIRLADKKKESIKYEKTVLLSEIAAMQSQIDVINKQLNDCFIISDLNGTIIEKYADRGEFAAMGKPLFKLANLNPIIFKGYISADQLNDIKLGQTIQVFYDITKSEMESLNGQVSWISASSEFTPKIIQTRDERVNMVYAFKAIVPNDGSLKIGMPAEVKIALD